MAQARGAGTLQFRLLLWKDYLIRKRKPITLAGILWASGIIFSLYVVRINVDDQDFPTCQFPARALPSAGMLTFLQSFMCSVNNECSPLDQHEDIPTYENSKLTQIQRQFSPLLMNESVVDVAGSVPAALKLLATLSAVVDEPTFVNISKNGLKVDDLFINPTRVRIYLATRLDLEDNVALDIMTSSLSFQGILKGSLDRCKSTSISETLVLKNSEHLDILVKRLCSLTNQEVQTILMDLLLQVNFSKYINMLGNMYFKMTGDNRLSSLAGTVTAVLRMSRLESFLPPEMVKIFQGKQADFSYFDLELMPKLVELFKPTFGDTDAYQTVRQFADIAVISVQYLDKFLVKQTNDSAESKVSVINGVGSKNTIDLKTVTRAFSNAVEVFQEAMASDSSVDVFDVLSKLTNFIHKLLPEKQKYNVIFFSTLMTKLIESANQVININMHIEERVYNVSLRHPEGVKILVGLSSAIIAKGFEGLTDAKRTQIVTAKINTPAQMFCDVRRIQGFFMVSLEEAKSLKSKLCSNAWKNYIADFIRSFGVYDVRDNINAMASIVVKETFGKDVTKDLYTIDHDFLVLKNFTNTLSSIRRESRPALDWAKLFNVTKDSEFMKTVQNKSHLGKQMLVIAHGAIAKEVVNQNSILSYKISPLLVDATTLVIALNQQLDATPGRVARAVREMYPAVLLTVLSTAFDQDRTYRSLSTHSLDIMCHGVENSLQYLDFPPHVDRERLVAALCDMSAAIESGLTNDSAIGKAIAKLRNSSLTSQNVDWTGLISGLKDLYVKLERDYPYLFEYGGYGMDAATRAQLNDMVERAKEFWFGKDSLGRSLHLSMKLGFRLLDLLDRGMLGLADETWLQVKYVLSAVGGPLRVVHDLVKVVSAISRNESHTSALPAGAVAPLRALVPALPQLLVDAAALIVRDDTQIEPIIETLNGEPPWPCSADSLAALLHVSVPAGAALRALERVLCLPEPDQREWRHYLEERNVTAFNFKNWNKTTYGPNEFLKVSATFSSLAEDVGLVTQLLEELTTRSAPGGRLSWADAWDTAWDMLNGADRDVVLIKFFRKLDAVVNAVNTSGAAGAGAAEGAPLHAAWAHYRACSNASLIDDSCKAVGRAAWKHSIQFVSVLFQNAATDLLTYFKEINEPNYSLLQMLGFTRGTALHEMHDKLPEFMGVLLNSYFDYGFMSQVRRASNSQFWDCEALVEALVPPPGSRIDGATLLRVQPYVCPSLFHWLSFPRGENTLMDIIAKPQYFLFTMHVQNLTSNYTDAYKKITELSNFLTNVTNQNKTVLSADDFKISNLQKKLNNLVDSFMNFIINETDSSYRRFAEISTKQYTSAIYLTRVVAIFNKLLTALDNLNITDLKDVIDDDKNKLEAELTSIQKIFKRRPNEAIALHFDVLSEVLWKNGENYDLAKALDETCNDLKSNTTKDILVENQRVKTLVCSKSYRLIYGAVHHVIQDDYVKAKDALLNLVKTLQDGDINNVTEISEFFNQRQQLKMSLKTSVTYAFEVGTPIYLQYLQSNLRHYDVVLALMAGGDWWAELRALYDGPYARDFFDSMQQSLDVVEDVLSNLDKIHLVRLLHDINVNNSDAFCAPAVVLSDYLPDGAGVLARLQRRMCDTDRAQLFRELPPLLFASQGYDDSLKLPKVVNYTALNLDISRTESGLDLVEKGLEAPQRPRWITDDKLAHLRTVILRLLSRQTLTRISFGVFSNLVDAGTLFLNNSQCTLCSELTSWFKQLNLQVFKKQEYDSLLCHLHTLTLDDVHQTLKNDFHWDMAIKELLLTRNYTKYELNKSLNEFLELVKLHLLDDMSVNVTKLGDCLARNVTRNDFGNAALVTYILSRTARLIRAELPHLHEVEGISNLTYLKQLSADVAHNLDARAPLKNYLTVGEVTKQLSRVVRDTSVVDDIMDSDVYLNAVQNDLLLLSRRVMLRNNSWQDICREYDCTEIARIISNNVNNTLVDRDLPNLQAQEFWRFTFVSNIVSHMEDLLNHGGRLMGVASQLDVAGVMKGQLTSLVDFLMQVLKDGNIDDIIYSLQGITTEVEPLLQGTPLQSDLGALAAGLAVLRQFKHYLLEQNELKVRVSELFPDPEAVEAALSALGVNNTNFWSVAAPRLRAGHIDLTPLLSSTHGDYHISDFICQLVPMSQVLVPSALDVVTADDVLGAVAEQFCELPDELAKQLVPVLLENLNTSYILDKVMSTVLARLFSAANLTAAQGAAVLEKAPQMAALLPVIRDNMGGLVDTIADEPLLRSLKNFSSVGSLLSSSSFLADAGAMVCGKPFRADLGRVYKAVAQSQDFTREPDQAQLDALPTDFCRGLYKDVVGMEAGKIVWSFVKPLIMGKILYTPDNPRVGRIMHKANASFATMIKLTGIVHSFADSFPSLDILSDHRAGIAALRNLITAPSFSELRAKIVGDGDIPDIDVDGLFDEFGDIHGIGSILSKASDLLRCVNLNRFRAMPDEHRLTHEAVRLSRVNEFSAGIVFLNSEKGEVPNVEYKIRMDIENTPTTTRMSSYLWIPGPESSFLEHMRYFRGFIQIQDIVNKAIIELSRSNSRIHKRETEREEPKWAMYTQQEPYPCYRKDFFQTSLYESQALMVAFFFSLLFTVCSAVRFIVADKESGNTMLMSVMGVDLTYHTRSWAVATLAELLVTCACVTAVLCAGGVLPRTEPSLVFCLMLAFGISVLSCCYLMSKVFSTASSAAVVTGIVYLISFMPFVLILSLEAVISAALKYLVCLSMTSAICYSLLMITRAEAMGRGATWADVFSAPNEGDLSIAEGAIMALVDAVIYFVIGYLLDRYFGPKTLQSNITYSTTSGEKAGVSIVNVSKVYGEGTRRPKMALDNVSIELTKGQITTLLGHNGAGKTTLIGILTGTLKPSSGHVTIRSDLAPGARVGLCPQRDVLFEYMSAREHVALYAQLKSGKALKHVQDEVQSMLSVLSLGALASEPVVRLSGGTRRRVCVALAFVARPHLVSLDEPTAGVDPAARRDIWSMIVKLRQDRTILMTTHHLDEAELLSDQIVIMHKGQVHTTGSPIEIKRSLGSGYKLTVMYPNKTLSYEEPWMEDECEDLSFEEKTKVLLAVVRDCIKNANLVDVNNDEVEIALPFYDANGLNNDFFHLCTALESRKAELGYRSYSLDCSSLEQVFFNICQEADAPPTVIKYDPEIPSKSPSTSSVKSDETPLVPAEGPLKGFQWQQFSALLHARYLHYTRNKWLLFLLLVLPALFVLTAMAFSLVRPPADNELSLRLHPGLYERSAQYLVRNPSIYSENLDPSFAQRVMDALKLDQSRNWTEADSPTCVCTETRQDCELDADSFKNHPEMMLLPDTETLNRWIVASTDVYIKKRYGGFSSSLKNNVTNLVAWYNNKGHHAMPAFLNALSTALLRAVSGEPGATITVYSHPLKISKEQLSKDTVYQHVADAGISALVLLAYSLVSGGAAVYLVTARRTQEKRLQLLCGVSPALYWAAALAADLTVIAINIVMTAIMFEAFGFPVFVARNNLPAICLLLLLYGYACGALVHGAEKLFSEASLANMLLFCGNAFVGLGGLTLLLVLDIISDSDATDNARWYLHKLLLLCPQFVLADGLLEIAKNTIQAEVLYRFGMDTYKDPLSTSLIGFHYLSLVVVGTALLLLNLAIEYHWFDTILTRFSSELLSEAPLGELEDLEVCAERKRVQEAVARAESAVRLPTIGNINAGFVDTEVKKNSIKRVASPASDVAQCVALGKEYPALRGRRVAVRALSLGIHPGQCTALLGQNGAGKSTTFAMLTGEVRPTAGQIYLNERRVDCITLCQGLISYCPQSDALDPLITVRETLKLYCRLRGITDQDEVIKRTLEMCGLQRYAEVRGGALSGGTARKLCAAIAFMGRAPLVLLDEPTSGMDPGSRVCVSRGVRAACAAQRGVLLSTHALDDARRLAARVALMRAGSLCALASLDDCLKRFGGGFAVACRVSRGAGAGPRDVWRRVRARAPHAALRVMHHAILHFTLPLHATVNQKEVTTSLSDVFRLMSELQAACDIEDFTVNQSSLDQMFLSFTDKAEGLEPVELEALPAPEVLHKDHTDLDTVTSL